MEGTEEGIVDGSARTELLGRSARAENRRSRLIDATVEGLSELSVDRLSHSVVTCGKTARGEIAEVFGSERECLSAAFEEGIARLSRAVSDEVARQEVGRDAGRSDGARWLGRVRAGLVGLLGFLDDEPAWGRLLILAAPAAGLSGVECERHVFRVLGELLGEGPGEQAVGQQLSPSRELIGELVVGGALSAIRVRMLDADGERLVELAPSLMSFIVAPYLGQASASAEFSGRSEADMRVRAGVAGLGVGSPLCATRMRRTGGSA